MEGPGPWRVKASRESSGRNTDVTTLEANAALRSIVRRDSRAVSVYSPSRIVETFSQRSPLLDLSKSSRGPPSMMSAAT